MVQRDSLEMTLGHSHRCISCRATFLKHEDGCPHCRMSAPTQPLKKANYKSKTLYWVIWDLKTGKMIYIIPSGPFSWWPKEENEEEKEK